MTNIMRNKKGFTLIELLIVVVIIGILAAIAIPKFANTKDKAYVAAMKSDLRNLATYEEQYAADNDGAYFAWNRDHRRRRFRASRPSQNVTVMVTNVAGPPPSWSATATHSQSAKTCDDDQRRDHLRLSRMRKRKRGRPKAVPVFCPVFVYFFGSRISPI